MAAQFDLEKTFTELARNGLYSAQAQGQAQLQALGQLQRQIGSMSLAGLAAMRGEIAGAINQALSIADQGRSASKAEDIDATLAAVSKQTRDTIAALSTDLFERRVFDPYLRFTSTDEESEYRRREEERQAYIRVELAKGTPEGTLNAANATVDQIKDAGAHGADRSPEYQRIFNEAIRAQNEQTAAIEQASTTPALDKAKELERETETNEFDEIAAAFKASGVTLPDTELGGSKGHGLANATIDRNSGPSVRQT